MANYIVYDTNKRLVIDDVSSNLSNEQLLVPYISKIEQTLTVATGVSTQTIYSGTGLFDFIDFKSDQTVTIDVKNDGTTIFTGQIKNLRLDYAGENLSIIISNASGYTANIEFIVSNNQTE